MKQKLISEQLPNDGGWHWSRLVNEANDRLNKIGKHGKRAKIKVIPKPGKPISTQFSLPGVGQKSYGLNLSLDQKNLIEAEEICTLITSQLVAGTYTQEWLDSLLGKQKLPTEKEKSLTCGKLIEQYKSHYFKQRKAYKNPRQSWKIYHSHAEKILLMNHDRPINTNIITEIIECTENNTLGRKYHLNGLANLLKYFEIDDFKQLIKRYKSENKPKFHNKYIPDDKEITDIYNIGFEINPNCAKDRRYRYSQWQFLYALLATYGLRVHEAWNIKNWDKTVTLKNGDWIAISNRKEDDNENEEYIYQWKKKQLIIPAILDPNNKDYLLCIGHDTKTGYRVAFPISPSGHSRNCTWIKEFNLIQSLNLPDLPNPLAYKGKNNDSSYACTNMTGLWFRNHNYGFTPHALRHAYNIRGHKLEINQKVLADSLGHGLEMNSNNYLRHENDISKIQGIRQEVSKQAQKISKIQKLQDQLDKTLKQNAYLTDENKYLKTEIEKLRTKLAMYEAIEQSEPN